jgi:glycosyltransferase involved in cell wall biosynthesis
LAAGKPVLVSRAIPMADYVEKKKCGVVVEKAAPVDVITAVKNLEQNYQVLQKSVRESGSCDFSQQQMIESYKKVYGHFLVSKS